MTRTLREMVIVITGASAGIGQALAEVCAKEGARLVLAARRSDRLEELNRKLGGNHLPIVCDVSRTDDCKNLIDRAMSHFGRIDTLVCNAGFGIYKPVADLTPQQTRGLFDTNVFGTTDCIHFALPHMVKQDKRDGYRGQIMLVSSAAVRRGVPYIGTYSATKAAQLSIAEALRVELHSARIAVTSVHPIQTSTEFGQVAEAQGDTKIAGSPTSQTADHVARTMLRAIQRPRAEVWPSMPSGWVLSFGTLMPSLVDRVMRKYLKQVEREQEK